MWRPRNVSVIPGRGIGPPVGNGISVICTDMWRHIIWIWDSYGGARCPGAPCGTARRRTAWITSGGGGGGEGGARCAVGQSASLENFSRRGLSSARFGWMPSNPAIRGCPPTSCCSATLTSRWRVITGSSSVGCHILRFGGTTAHVFECLCHRQRPWHSVIWHTRFRPSSVSVHHALSG